MNHDRKEKIGYEFQLSITKIALKWPVCTPRNRSRAEICVSEIKQKWSLYKMDSCLTKVNIIISVGNK